MTRWGPRGKYHLWSGEDRIALRQFSLKISVEEQARILGRSVAVIRAQRRYLGLPAAISEKKLLKPSEGSSTQLHVKLDNETFDSLVLLARQKKVSLTQYAREVLLKHVLVNVPKKENNDG